MSDWLCINSDLRIILGCVEKTPWNWGSKIKHRSSVNKKEMLLCWRFADWNFLPFMALQTVVHTFITFPTRKFPPEPSRKHLKFDTQASTKKVLLEGWSSMRKHEKVALKIQCATHQSCVHKVQKSNTHAHVKPTCKCQEYKLYK